MLKCPPEITVRIELSTPHPGITGIKGLFNVRRHQRSRGRAPVTSNLQSEGAVEADQPRRTDVPMRSVRYQVPDHLPVIGPEEQGATRRMVHIRAGYLLVGMPKAYLRTAVSPALVRPPYVPSGKTAREIKSLSDPESVPQRGLCRGCAGHGAQANQAWMQTRY